MEKIDSIMAVVVVFVFEAVWRTLEQSEEEWLLLLVAAGRSSSLWWWTLRPFLDSLCSDVCVFFPPLCVGLSETEFKDTITSTV